MIMKKIVKWVGYLLYYGIAQWLPSNKVPLVGSLSKRFRGSLC